MINYELRDNPNCKTCDSLKCYAVRKQIYYCDNEDRTDEMGKLGTELPTTSAEWCPKRK